MTDKIAEQLLKKILDEIQLPASAYETAINRYQNLGQWYHRPESTCQQFNPEIFSQGSFRLGIANNGQHYDLDLGCKLSVGLSKSSHTQKELKRLVGAELESYRLANGVKEELDEKRRCWRLIYADGFTFHIDVVPCIPEDDVGRDVLKSRMIERSNFEEDLAVSVSELALSITDNQDPQYNEITSDWRISNPQGYAQWFEARMKLGRLFLEKRAADIGASIEDVPVFRWKTPLQGVVQLLKHHRDVMFVNEHDMQPISIIITTLAARAYNGESDLVSALTNILNEMDRHVSPVAPRVANPVNPEEDFADKWDAPDQANLNLEANFRRWLIQAKADFAAICKHQTPDLVLEAAQRGLNTKLEESLVQQALGYSPAAVPSTTRIKKTDPQPWRK
ncbi:MAG: nucleotidyltransferase [Pseudomonadaceae bacterium]|nr:nucleotidyltransferase [Pseudomonadaceae bacterium]